MSEGMRVLDGRRGERQRGPDEPLHKGVYLLPNLLTTCGLFSGFYAIISTINAAFLRMFSVSDATFGMESRVVNSCNSRRSLARR